MFESMVDKTQLRPETRRRAGQTLSAAADALGCDATELDRLIGGSEATRLQPGIAIVAAERSTWPPQVVALGKVLAAGLIADGDKVDVQRFALDAMTNLGRLHVSLLELLVHRSARWCQAGASR